MTRNYANVKKKGKQMKYNKRQEAVLARHRGTPGYVHFLRMFLDANNIKRSIPDVMRDRELRGIFEEHLIILGFEERYGHGLKGNC